MSRFSRTPLTVVATAALAGAVIAGGGAAWAAWSVSGGGAGSTTAGSLVTPAVTATRSATTPTTAIDLSWTAAGQLPGATYSVTRNGTTISCANPCTDSGLTPGTSYTYAVTPKVGASWSASSGSATASTSVPAVSTTTTVQSSQNPARSGVAVTLTATVTAGSGTPTGSVTFKDGGTAIACTGGTARPLSGGSASCQATFSTTGAHSITAEYSGASGFAASTSSPLSQRIVNGSVTGLAFANVTVQGTAVTPACTGSGTGNLVCTVSSGSTNNAVLVADVGFVTAAGSPTTYATDVATSLPWTATGKATPNSGSASVAAGTSTSTGGSMKAQKSGNTSATITVTFNDGANSFTATLTVN